jgi:hypothetical protein
MKNTGMKIDEADAVRQLMSDILAIPKGPVGTHLLDEQFEAYVLETMSEREKQDTEDHLRGCRDCAEEMTWFTGQLELLEHKKDWRVLKKHLDDMRERLFPSKEPDTDRQTGNSFDGDPEDQEGYGREAAGIVSEDRAVHYATGWMSDLLSGYPEFAGACGSTPSNNRGSE